ncbi:hypothetical protein GS432_19870 [Rhodococcus hoagii]|nr:hypothetical protein [Prescottella equi]
MTAYLYDGDLDAILENITTPPAKARVLVDHYSSLADGSSASSPPASSTA